MVLNLVVYGILKCDTGGIGERGSMPPDEPDGGMW